MGPGRSVLGPELQCQARAERLLGWSLEPGACKPCNEQGGEFSSGEAWAEDGLSLGIESGASEDRKLPGVATCPGDGSLAGCCCREPRV